jgi:transcriptional regulator with XRE-family HTH domain
MRAGLSLRELARRVGLTPSAISQFETGKTKPSVGTLFEIVEVLDVSLDDMLKPLARSHAPEPSASGSDGQVCASRTGFTRDIRDYAPADEEAVVALSLRAWAPVFASLEQALGRDLLARLHPDWRDDQEQAVRAVLADPEMHVWVAVAGPEPVGFAAATLDSGRLIGELCMLAVDPDHQDQGTGGALTETATGWLRSRGMRVAMIDTGGDPGHAAARRVYERAGYTKLPIARYFLAL